MNKIAENLVRVNSSYALEIDNNKHRSRKIYVHFLCA